MSLNDCYREVCDIGTNVKPTYNIKVKKEITSKFGEGKGPPEG